MEQDQLLRLTFEILERLEIPYALVGSYGSSVYGEPRFTRDIDIVVGLTSPKVAPFCKEFPRDEFYLSEPAVREAVRTRHQFNLLHPGSGNKVDFILPGETAWSRSQLSRAARLQVLPGLEGLVAAPEDVILGKLWYHAEGGGERHVRDIAGMLRVSGNRVNRAEVERWATELGYLDIWRRIEAIANATDTNPPAG